MTTERRDILKQMAAAGALGAGSAAATPPARAAGRPAYDPDARFELAVSEVELRRNPAGRLLKARIYQPQGPGPFPAVLDLHGGAWNRKDRLAEEPMDRALAASGLLVVAVDLTVAGEAPYPACVQDAHWSVRWLKANAAKWNGDAARLGLFGSSSGGHVAELIALKPHDARYGALPLPEAAGLDAGVAWLATRSPVSDTAARYANAERRGNAAMMQNNKAFFVPWETIHEGNPREILDRGEAAAPPPPLLILQGALDDNVLPERQEAFAAAWRAAGGACEYRLFENSGHEWVAEPGPQTDAARRTARQFIARQLAA